MLSVFLKRVFDPENIIISQEELFLIYFFTCFLQIEMKIQKGDAGKGFNLLDVFSYFLYCIKFLMLLNSISVEHYS